MKVYLKNGRTININQYIANEITRMKSEQDEQNMLVAKNKTNKNVIFMIDVKEVIAIK